jgi:hypothetical protein
VRVCVCVCVCQRVSVCVFVCPSMRLMYRYFRGKCDGASTVGEVDEEASTRGDPSEVARAYSLFLSREVVRRRPRSFGDEFVGDTFVACVGDTLIGCIPGGACRCWRFSLNCFRFSSPSFHFPTAPLSSGPSTSVPPTRAPQITFGLAAGLVVGGRGTTSVPTVRHCLCAFSIIASVTAGAASSLRLSPVAS